MGSVGLHLLRQDNPGKSDAELARILAEKYGHMVVVRYKNTEGLENFTNLGCADSQAAVDEYFNSPYCHETEIVYDVRK